jgi:hypothetical protein
VVNPKSKVGFNKRAFTVAIFEVFTFTSVLEVKQPGFALAVVVKV